MNDNWTTTRLGSLIDTRKGYAFKAKWYSDVGRAVVKVSDFTADSVDTDNLTVIPEKIAKDYLRYELHTDDVVIQTVGSWPSNPASVVGKAVRIPYGADGALLNQNAVRVIPSESIGKKFLFYLLRNEHFKGYIIGTAQGSANQASITLDSLRAYEFSLPPLPIQRKIAGILSAYDDLIENNARRIKILEEMAQRIYREWFIDFRYPGYENQKLVESELGLIPDGWEVVPLLDLSDVTYGYAFKSKLFNTDNTGKKVIRIRDIVPNKTETYSPEQVDEKYLVENCDILVGMDGDFYTGIWAGGNSYLNQRVARLRPKEGFSTYLLFHSIQKPIRKLNQAIVGTTVAHLSARDIQAIKIPKASDEISEQCFGLFEPIVSEEISLRQKNQILRQIRDLLLPKLISGEIDVSELDIETGDKE